MIVILDSVLITVSVASLLFTIYNILVTRYFFKQQTDENDESFLPTVSILKALKGMEDGLEDNLRSFCQLDYPEYEVIFCVEDEKDPAISVVKKVIAEYKNLPLRLITPCPRLGANPKISNLIYGLKQARHQIIVYNDSEVRVPRNYLRKFVPPLADERVGAVIGFPIYQGAQNWVAGLEALTLNANIFSMLISPYLGNSLDAVIGATVAIRRKVLESCRLFEIAKDHVADDGIIGKTLVQNGYQIKLIKFVIPMIKYREKFREYFLRNLRWSRAIRIMKTKGYFILGSLMGSLYAFLYWVMHPAQRFALGLLLFLTLARLIQIIYNNKKYVKNIIAWRYLWLVPIRDIFLSPVLWLLGAFGNTVWWRGIKYRIDRRGNMVMMSH